jgi:hypothetical protein
MDVKTQKALAQLQPGLLDEVNPSTPRPKGRGLLRVDPEPRSLTPFSKKELGAAEWVHQRSPSENVSTFIAAVPFV